MKYRGMSNRRVKAEADSVPVEVDSEAVEAAVMDEEATVADQAGGMAMVGAPATRGQVMAKQARSHSLDKAHLVGDTTLTGPGGRLKNK
jgi:hypothetical protein